MFALFQLKFLLISNKYIITFETNETIEFELELLSKVPNSPKFHYCLKGKDNLNFEYLENLEYAYNQLKEIMGKLKKTDFGTIIQKKKQNIKIKIEEINEILYQIH